MTTFLKHHPKTAFLSIVPLGIMMLLTGVLFAMRGSLPAHAQGGLSVTLKLSAAGGTPATSLTVNAGTTVYANWSIASLPDPSYVAFIWCNSVNASSDPLLLPTPDIGLNTAGASQSLALTQCNNRWPSGNYSVKILIGSPDMSDTSPKGESRASLTVSGSSSTGGRDLQVVWPMDLKGCQQALMAYLDKKTRYLDGTPNCSGFPTGFEIDVDQFCEGTFKTFYDGSVMSPPRPNGFYATHYTYVPDYYPYPYAQYPALYGTPYNYYVWYNGGTNTANVGFNYDSAERTNATPQPLTNCQTLKRVSTCGPETAYPYSFTTQNTTTPVACPTLPTCSLTASPAKASYCVGDTLTMTANWSGGDGTAYWHGEHNNVADTGHAQINGNTHTWVFGAGDVGTHTRFFHVPSSAIHNGHMACQSNLLSFSVNNCAPTQTCGNGVKEGTEQCDAGSKNGACPAICSATCTTNSCGTTNTCSQSNCSACTQSQCAAPACNWNGSACVFATQPPPPPGFDTCTNPSPIPTGFAAPCPVFSLQAPAFGSTNATASLSPIPNATSHYIYTKVYVSKASTETCPSGTTAVSGNTSWCLTSLQLTQGSYQPNTNPANIYVANNTSAQASLALTGFSKTQHWVLVWDWNYDASRSTSTSQCWLGPGGTSCYTSGSSGGAKWRAQPVTVP